MEFPVTARIDYTSGRSDTLVLVASGSLTEHVFELKEKVLRISVNDDHGTLARRVDADVDEAEAVWAGLAEVGIDLDAVADQLEREGVSSFQKSFDELLGALGAKAEELRSR